MWMHIAYFEVESITVSNAETKYLMNMLFTSKKNIIKT